MIETIGKVTLNYKFYSGSDSYSDGDIEDEILQIVENNDRSHFNEIIAKRKDWTILYHLSHIRANVVRGLDISKNDNVLEIGSGCGAITGALAEKAKKVTCIELSKRRSMINANQNKNCGNVEIIVGNFQDIEPYLEEKYDIITLIGVYEYANLYIQGKDSYYDFIDIIGRHLAPGGRVVVAIENKFGLKYWAGCQEDHIGGHFTGIEGYQENRNGIKTFSKRELQSIFKRAGYLYQEFYYPYPDYKLPSTIYTDRYLPKVVDLNKNMRNFDNERLMLFDEQNVYGEILVEDMYSFFANSYIAIISKQKIEKKEKLLYVNLSNDRDKRFFVKTEIFVNESGNKIVKKAPMNMESIHHVKAYVEHKNDLKNVYAKTKLYPCDCEIQNNEVYFAYIEDETLQEKLDRYAEDENFEKIKEEIQMIFDECRKAAHIKFRETEEFTQIFGKVQLNDGMMAAEVSNVNMLFSNIKDDATCLYMMDYEWCFDIPIPVDFILYRMLYYFAEESRNKQWLLKNDIFSLLGESRMYETEFKKMEEHFQKYIMGNHVSIEKLYEDIGRATQDVLANIEDLPKTFAKKRVRVYMDRGTGYTDDISYWLSLDNQNGLYSVDVPIDPDMIQIRIDPAEEPCFVDIKEITVKKQDGSRIVVNPELYVNAEKSQDGTYLFATYDPWIIFLLDLYDVCEVNVLLSIETIKGISRQDADIQFIQKNELLKQISGFEKSKECSVKEVDALKAEIERLQNEVQSQKAANDLMKNSLSWRVTKPIRDMKTKIKEFSNR